MAVAVGGREMVPDAAARSRSFEAAAHLGFVDVLRAWAVILMIEAHVFNALLRNDLRQTTAFEALTFANGIVAPAFLFLAGFTFVLSARRRWDDLLTLGGAFRRLLVRLGALLLVAYAIHLPSASLAVLITQTDRAQRVSFFQVDILQTIAASLLVLAVLVLIVRRPANLGRVALALAAAVALLTPIVWRYDFAGIVPLPVATYLNAADGSPFPLFPWSAYVFAGAFASQLFLRARATSARELEATMANLFCCGLLLLVIGPVAGSYLDRAYPHAGGWSPSPGSFAVRLGVVLLVVSAVWLRARGRPERSSRIGGVLQVVGRESLFAYCLHLVVIYGWLLPLPWRAELVGPTLGPLACLLVFAGVTGFTCCVTYGWHELKTRDRRASRAARLALAGALTCMLLIHTF